VLSYAERLLLAATIEFRAVDPLTKDAVGALNAYFAELDERFPGGFDPGDALVGEADHYRPPDGVFVVAYSEGEAAGCGGVTTLAPGLGEIKRMWIAPDMRGLGLGRRLLAQLEGRSAKLGHTAVRLDTNSVLTAAISMYRSAGYVEIDRYNENPYARHWFEKQLG
jgi:GNAT superfamily N-acetyltransferase